MLSRSENGSWGRKVGSRALQLVSILCPSIGRCISADPIGQLGLLQFETIERLALIGFEEVSLGSDAKLFVYASNNPIMASDPYGLDGEILGSGGKGMVVVACAALDCCLDRNRMQQVAQKVVVPEPRLVPLLAAGALFLSWIAGRRRRRVATIGVEGRVFGGWLWALSFALLALTLVPAVAQAQDADGDGIPDAYEISTQDSDPQTLDLDPNEPTDAILDFDQDGLRNIDEYQIGSDFRDPTSCGTLCHPIITFFEIDKSYIIDEGIIEATVTTLNATAVRIEPGSISISGGSGTVEVPIDSFGEVRLIASNANASRMETRDYEYYEETQAFTYNAASQRVRQVTDTTERLYIYGPNGEILAETAADGTSVAEYVYLEGEPLAQVHGSGGSSETYYVHNSHLGTPEVMTDSGKVPVWQIHTEPFGDVYQETGSAAQRARFPGQIADAGTKINYNWHRYYDPSIGRYLQADPIGQAGGVNVYTYAHNRPTALIDSDGRNPALGVLATPPGQAAAAAFANQCLVAATAVAAAFGIDGMITLMSEESADETPVPPAPGPNTPDQDAATQLAKEAAKKGGVSAEEAAALADLAAEAGVSPVRGPEAHPNRPYGKEPHYHIGKTKVPVR